MVDFYLSVQHLLILILPLLRGKTGQIAQILSPFSDIAQKTILVRHTAEATRGLGLTAEYCAQIWCHSAHTRLIDSVLNDALRIFTGCLLPIPTNHLPILSSIQPAELRRMGETLSLTPWISGPDHILYGLLSGFSDTRQVRLRSRRPFVPAARTLLDNLARLGIRASEWTNHKRKLEYCKGVSRFRAFVPGTDARPVGMGLHQAAWVKLNRLQTCTNRVLLLHRIASVAPLNKPQTMF